MVWVTADAPTKVELDSCVRCGLCLPHCPTFRLTGDETASPRGRLAAMSLVANGDEQVDAVFADVMGLCLQCRACEVVCPSLVPFGRAMEGARAEIATQLSLPGRKFRHFLLGKVLGMRFLVRLGSLGIAIAQRSGLSRIAFGPLKRLAGLRRLPILTGRYSGNVWESMGPTRGTVALLTGCVMEPWFSAVHNATVELLRRGGYRVEAPEGQTCCGALAAHDGAAVLAKRLAARNISAFDGYEMVVANSAGCGAHLKDYKNWGGEAVSKATRDIVEVVAEILDTGDLPELSLNGKQVAIQDPCHLRYAQRIIEEPRRILRAAGYEIVEIDSEGWCCGAAGTYTLTHPDMSEELGKRKANQVRETGAILVASANPGCELQLRSHLGSDYRIAHPIELYRDALRASDEKAVLK